MVRRVLADDPPQSIQRLRENADANFAELYTGAGVAGGTAQIAADAAEVTVTHALGYTPTRVIVSPRSNVVAASHWWVDTVGATTFSIKTNANVTAASDFDWIAFP